MDRLTWHRRRVSELDVQLAGLAGRRMTPVRRSLKEKRSGHLKTIKLLEKLL
jgi:hypothetical protein